MNKTSQLTSMFLLLICTGICNVNADSNNSTSKPFSELSKAEQIERSEKNTIKYANMIIQSRKTDFSCANIGVIDDGSALDGSVFYFNESTRELTCVTGMGFCLSTDPKDKKPCHCPPPDWKANGCDEKYRELLDSKDLLKWYGRKK